MMEYVLHRLVSEDSFVREKRTEKNPRLSMQNSWCQRIVVYCCPRMRFAIGFENRSSWLGQGAAREPSGRRPVKNDHGEGRQR